MRRGIASRVLGTLGGLLLVSTAVTLLFSLELSAGGRLTTAGVLVVSKAVLGLAAVAAGFALGEPGGVKRFFTGRAAHFGFFTAISALLLALILAVANWAAWKKPKSWDLTKNRIFTLSDDTQKTLSGLEEDVEAVAFYGQAEPAYGEAQELLRRYADRSPHFKVRLVDPWRSPEEVKRFAITDGGPRIVLRRGAAEARAREPSEQALTGALVQVTRSGKRKVYFTEGHGEPAPRDAGKSGYAAAVKALEGEGYEISTLSLLDKAEVPADASAVLVAAPRKAFLEPEVKALRHYAGRGGRLGLYLEPEANAGLDALLKDFGVEVDEDMVVDPNPVARLFGGTAVTPVVRPSAAHPISKDLAQTGLLFSTARSLVALRDAPAVPTPIALTGDTAWGETDVKSLYGKGAKRDEGEKGGPLPVAMAAERTFQGDKAARAVVVGDADFFANGYRDLLGNLDFFMNGVGWLAEQEDRITIRPRTREASRLFLSEAQVTALKIVTIDLVPVALLGLGLAVWLVRRSR
ncbi:MAG TPA: GldG family protein [Anaeromyxobacteraceae bacterium]|nr:GldG family protein [Anaeromyxobacteraceae bacterium]